MSLSELSSHSQVHFIKYLDVWDENMKILQKFSPFVDTMSLSTHATPTFFCVCVGHYSEMSLWTINGLQEVYSKVHGIALPWLALSLIVQVLLRNLASIQ